MDESKIRPDSGANWQIDKSNRDKVKKEPLYCFWESVSKYLPEMGKPCIREGKLTGAPVGWIFTQGMNKYWMGQDRFSNLVEMTKMADFAKEYFGHENLPKEIDVIQDALNMCQSFNDTEFKKLTENLLYMIDRILLYSELFDKDKGNIFVLNGLDNIDKQYSDTVYSEKLKALEDVTKYLTESFRSNHDRLIALRDAVKSIIETRKIKKDEVLIRWKKLPKLNEKPLKDLKRIEIESDFLTLKNTDDKNQKIYDQAFEMVENGLKEIEASAPNTKKLDDVNKHKKLLDELKQICQKFDQKKLEKLESKLEQSRNTIISKLLDSPKIEIGRIERFETNFSRIEKMVSELEPHKIEDMSAIKDKIDLLKEQHKTVSLIKDLDSSIEGVIKAQEAKIDSLSKESQESLEKLISFQPLIVDSMTYNEILKHAFSSISSFVAHLRTLRKSCEFDWFKDFENAIFALKDRLETIDDKKSLDQLSPALRYTIKGYLSNYFKDQSPVIISRTYDTLDAIKDKEPQLASSSEITRSQKTYSYFLFKKEGSSELKSAYVLYKQRDGIKVLGSGQYSNTITLAYDLKAHKMRAMKTIGYASVKSRNTPNLRMGYFPDIERKIQSRRKTFENYQKTIGDEELSGLLALKEANGIIKMHDFAKYHLEGSQKTLQKRAFFLELLKGGDLSSIFNKKIIKKGEITKKLLEILKTLHVNGVAARDIKPDNILMKNANTPILGDLGFIIEHNGRSESILGTSKYMPPEYFHDYQSVKDFRKHDVWSMGIVLYMLWNKGNLPYAFNKSLMNNLLKKRQYATLFDEFTKILPKNFKAIKDPKNDLEHLINAMLDPDPQKRIDGEAALAQFNKIPPTIIDKMS